MESEEIKTDSDFFSSSDNSSDLKLSKVPILLHTSTETDSFDGDVINTDEQNSDAKSKGERFALFCSLTACLGSLLFGMHIGFSSSTSSSIEKDANIDQYDMDTVWSMVTIGAIIGSTVVGKIVDDLGRKKGFYIGQLPLIVGPLLFISFINYTGMLIARLIIGIGVGFMSVLTPIYVSEISPPNLRGRLGSLNQLFIAGGVTLISFAGLPTVDYPHYWKIMLLLLLLPALLQAFIVYFSLPESPRWLLRQRTPDNDVKAIDVLSQLNGGRQEVFMDIYEKMKEQCIRDMDSDNNSIKNDFSQKEGESSDNVIRNNIINMDNNNFEHKQRVVTNKKLTIKILTDGSPVSKQFYLGLMIMLMQQWSGVNAIVFNTKQLFEEEGESEELLSDNAIRKALWGAVIVNIVQVLFTFISTFLMDRNGRRFLLLVSGIGVASSNLFLSFLYYFESAAGLKIFAVLVYFAFFGIGLGAVPWVYLSEIFAPSFRGVLMSIMTVVNWLSAFLITVFYHRMAAFLTTAGVFAFYGLLLIIFDGLVYKYVPETKGYSLEEIQYFFNSNDNVNGNNRETNINGRTEYSDEDNFGIFNSNDHLIDAHNDANGLDQERIEMNSLEEKDL